MHPAKAWLSSIFLEGSEKTALLKTQMNEDNLPRYPQSTARQSDATSEGSTRYSRSTLEQKTANETDLYERSQQNLSSDTEPLFFDLFVPPYRAGLTSTNSIDKNEEQITSARDQLLSIPDGNEPLRIEYEHSPPVEPPKSPLNLSLLIDFVGAMSIFDYLAIKDVLETGKVNRYMREIVDNYFLHYILPRTEIYYYVDHITEDEGPPSGEYQRLYPVIRRVDKELRKFPDNRVVFEPELDRSLKYTYRHGSFRHVEIKFHLWNWRRQRRNWPLHEKTSVSETPYSYKADGYCKSRKIPYTRMHQFVRFDTFNDSPIHIFYRDVPDTDGRVVTLHAISIPLNYIRHSLSASIPGSDEELAILRSNQKFSPRPSC